MTDPDESKEQDSLWVSSDLVPTATGETYMCAVSWGQDHICLLDRDAAIVYAMTVLDVAARAEYDQMIYAQMARLLKESNAALRIALELREDRPPVNDRATAPFQFVPLLRSSTRIAAVNVLVDGEPISQWDLADARQHALHVLDRAHRVDLDAAYFRYATGILGVPAEVGRAMVGELPEDESSDPSFRDQRPAGPVGPPLDPLPAWKATPAGLFVPAKNAPPPGNRAERRKRKK